MIGSVLRLLAALVLLFVLTSAAVILYYRDGKLPTTAFIISTDRVHNESGGKSPRARWQPLQQNAVPQVLLDAVIAAEDQRFCQHGGFDLVEIRRALRSAEQGNRLRGASTLSQQVARNLFLNRDRTIGRKLLEAWITILLEAFWDKPKIARTYANTVEFGVSHFGAQAAAQRYFGVDAVDLDASQAALMAAALPNPAIFRLDRPGQKMRATAARIEAEASKLRNLGYLGCLKDDSRTTVNEPGQ